MEHVAAWNAVLANELCTQDCRAKSCKPEHLFCLEHSKLWPHCYACGTESVDLIDHLCEPCSEQVAEAEPEECRACDGDGYWNDDVHTNQLCSVCRGTGFEETP